jgi:hypothetical protein
LSAAALGADQPLSPIGHSRFGAVPLGHLGRVGLDLMPAILAPNDQPDACGGSVAERHRRAGLGFHLTPALTTEVFPKESPCQLNCLGYPLQVVFIPLCMGCFCAHVSGHFCLFALLAGNYGLPC